MLVQLNGEPFELADEIDVSQLLRKLELAGKPVAVEVNAELIPADAHDGYHLNNGDVVEVVTLVGGG